MADFVMPSLGADMDQGTVIEWLVEPGDTVRKGDLVAVIDTSKSAVDVECFESGVIEKLLVRPGQTVPVGTPLAVIAPAAGTEPAEPPEAPSEKTAEKPAWTAGEKPLEKALERPAAVEPAARQPAVPAVPAVPVVPVAPAERPAAGKPARAAPVSPVVRKLAAKVGVDLAAVHGTGRAGAITRRDVERAASARRSPAGKPAKSTPTTAGRPRISPYARRLAAELGVDPATLTANGVIHAADVQVARPLAAGSQAERPPAADAQAAGPLAAGAAAVQPAERRPPAGRVATGGGVSGQARELTAALMARSKREIPHYYLATGIDLQRTMTWLHERNLQVPIEDRLVPAALLLRAVARAAREVPELNGHWTEGSLRPSPTVDLGVAVSLHGGGLLVPTLQDAASLSALDVMHWLREAVRRVRTGRLRSSELAPGSITVTNLGDLGVELVHGVIYPPQVALVGFGAVLDRPWAAGGMLGVRPVITATLAADHRATDGAVGARFLHTIDRLLQSPEEL